MSEVSLIRAQSFKSFGSVIHFAHGILSGALFWTSWIVSVFLYGQFFLYEYVEESKIKDEMYAELREWSAGFVIGLLAAYLALKIP